MRYYWLKLKEHFFDDNQIKSLLALPNGEKIVIVYLRMQLLSLRTEGIIRYSSLLPGTSKELAEVLNEDPEIVSLTVKELENLSLVEVWDDQTIYMTALKELMASETGGAVRMRKMRGLKDTVGKKISSPKKEKLAINPTPNPKIQYADSVSMGKEEYEKLVANYGENATSRMIEILDNYKGSNGKTYKSDYKAILSWVVDRHKEEQSKNNINSMSVKTNASYDNGESFI